MRSRGSKRNPIKVQVPIAQKLWRALSSTRLALILILAMAVLCLIGALLVQVPAEVSADPSKYQFWVQNLAKPRFGFWADILSFLRLFDVFHSPWFLVLGSLLMVNILFCTINRWKNVSATARGGNINPGVEFFNKGTDKEKLLIPEAASKVSPIIADILRKNHYRVRAQASVEGISIAGDKNRFSPFGTFLIHLSLILFVLGFVIGSFWGFRDTLFIVPEGSIREVGHGTGLSLELNSFKDEYWPNGSPKDYRSQVVLYDKGQEVKQGLVRVNSPLSYRGVNFYQSTFGPAVRIQVHRAGELIYDQPVPLSRVLTTGMLQRPAGVFSLSGELAVDLVGSAFHGYDSLIGENQLVLQIYDMKASQPVVSGVLEMGAPSEFEGMQFTFISKAQYSGFDVTRNPGITLIWTACSLLVIGLGLVFYFPFRRLWVLVESKGKGQSLLMMRSTGKSGLSGTKEINDMMYQIKGKLSERQKEVNNG